MNSNRIVRRRLNLESLEGRDLPSANLLNPLTIQAPLGETVTGQTSLCCSMKEKITGPPWRRRPSLFL
jgi:hypothetical protein